MRAKGCFSQEHTAGHVSTLGLGVLPVWSPLGAPCPPGTASGAPASRLGAGVTLQTCNLSLMSLRGIFVLAVGQDTLTSQPNPWRVTGQCCGTTNALSWLCLSQLGHPELGGSTLSSCTDPSEEEGKRRKNIFNFYHCKAYKFTWLHGVSAHPRQDMAFSFCPGKRKTCKFTRGCKSAVKKLHQSPSLCC